MFSVDGGPFRYRSASKWSLVDRSASIVPWDTTEEMTLVGVEPKRGRLLTGQEVQQLIQAVGETFPDVDTSSMGQAEGLAHLLFAGVRDPDGSSIFDHTRAVARVVAQLTSDRDAVEQRVAVDLAWLHRLPSAGTSSYYTVITRGHLSAWGVRSPELVPRIFRFAKVRTESVRDVYSRLAQDDITRIVALASVVVSECANPARRRELLSLRSRPGAEIRDLDSVTGPILDILGWAQDDGHQVVQAALEAVDSVGLVASVSGQFFVSTGSAAPLARMGDLSLPARRAVKDPARAQKAVSVVCAIFEEAFRELGIAHQVDGEFVERAGIRQESQGNLSWQSFVESIDPEAADAFVEYYFPLSGLASREDFAEFLGQMVARFHRVFQVLPRTVRVCPEVIWVLLAPFACSERILLGSPDWGWQVAGKVPDWLGFRFSSYTKDWYSWDQRFGDFWGRHDGLGSSALRLLLDPRLAGVRISSSRHYGDERACSLEIHRVAGEVWVVATKGTRTFVSIVTAATEEESVRGPIMLAQPLPIPDFTDSFGPTQRAIGEAQHWLEEGHLWQVDSVTRIHSIPRGLLFSSSTTMETNEGRGFHRGVVLRDGPPALGLSAGEGLCFYRFAMEEVSDPDFRVVRMRGESLAEALYSLASASTVGLAFIDREPAETALHQHAALSDLRENPLLGSAWQPLAAELVRVINRLKRRDFWRLQTLNPRQRYSPRNSPYAQAIREDDGSFHLEVGPTDLLRLEDPKVTAMMEFMGWSAPEGGGFPNFSQVFPATTPPAKVVGTALQTLTLMFDVSRAALFDYHGVGEEGFNRSGILDDVPVANGRYTGTAVGLRGCHSFESAETIIARTAEKDPAEVWGAIGEASSGIGHTDEPVYAAVVDPDDPRAVQGLMAIAPPGVDGGMPEAFRWTGHSWEADDAVLAAFLSGSPPSIVSLRADDLASVARQIADAAGRSWRPPDRSNDWRWLDLPGPQSLQRVEVQRAVALLFQGHSLQEVAKRRRYSGTQRRELERRWLAGVVRIRRGEKWFLVLEREWWWLHPQLLLLRSATDSDASRALAWFDDPGVDKSFVTSIILEYRQDDDDWTVCEPDIGGVGFPAYGDRIPFMGWYDPGEGTSPERKHYRILIPEDLIPGIDVRSREDWGGPLGKKGDADGSIGPSSVTRVEDSPPEKVPVRRIGVWELTHGEWATFARWVGALTLDSAGLHVDQALSDKWEEFRAISPPLGFDQSERFFERFVRRSPSFENWFSWEMDAEAVFGDIPFDMGV